MKTDIKEKSKSQPEENIAERVKSRRQKSYHKEIFDTSSNCTDKNIDEFVDVPHHMSPLEGDEEEVKERKGL